MGLVCSAGWVGDGWLSSVGEHVRRVMVRWVLVVETACSTHHLKVLFEPYWSVQLSEFNCGTKKRKIIGCPIVRGPSVLVWLFILSVYIAAFFVLYERIILTIPGIPVTNNME